MTEEERDRLNSFEAKLWSFIRQQQELKKENQTLRTRLQEKETELNALSERNHTLQEQYAHLKTALTIDAAGGQVRDTKLRLSKLVREIDKCIALLNE